MPAAPRTSSKATRIAYRILGVPGSMRNEKKDNARNKRLTFENTRLIK